MKPNYTIETWHDEDAESPREWDNLGVMHCAHGRYNLGDVQTSPDDIAPILEASNGLYLPLYLYDHSGITMNTTGFSCRWDSGKVGYIVADIEKIKKEFGWKIITAKRRARILEILDNEVKDYSSYIEGDVYGYTVTNVNDADDEHTCGGYYGEDNALSEAKSLVLYLIAKAPQMELALD